jgi:hypothetical protein
MEVALWKVKLCIPNSLALVPARERRPRSALALYGRSAAAAYMEGPAAVYPAVALDPQISRALWKSLYGIPKSTESLQVWGSLSVEGEERRRIGSRSALYMEGEADRGECVEKSKRNPARARRRQTEASG